MNRHETFLPAPTEAEKALGEKAKKDDKPKDKVRTAKKIQKDMEKWAKMLNQKKESQKVAPAAVATPTAGPSLAAPSQKGKDTGNNKNLKSEDQSLNLTVVFFCSTCIQCCGSGPKLDPYSETLWIKHRGKWLD